MLANPLPGRLSRRVSGTVKGEKTRHGQNPYEYGWTQIRKRTHSSSGGGPVKRPGIKGPRWVEKPNFSLWGPGKPRPPVLAGIAKKWGPVLGFPRESSAWETGGKMEPREIWGDLGRAPRVAPQKFSGRPGGESAGKKGPH